jgi:hypothetical protein
MIKNLNILQLKKNEFVKHAMVSVKSFQATRELLALQREYLELKNRKFMSFYFLDLWVIFAFLDPDPN